MSLVEYIVQLMAACPHIAIESTEMHVDGVDENAPGYSIDNEPVNTIVKRYLNGDAIRQFTFALTSRKDTFTNEEKAQNTFLFEEVTNWMEQQTRLRRLPVLDVDRRPMKLEALDSGYPLEMSEDNNSGLYAMQCRLTYYEKARNKA